MTRAVLFDLDGTLADTALDLGNALNLLRSEHALSPLPFEQIRPIASHGARGLIKLGFNVTPDNKNFEPLRQRFLQLYDENICHKTTLFDGVQTFLAQLAKQQYPWGIVTNKPAKFTDRLVPLLNFVIPPAVVVSGDTVEVAKPHPQPLFYAAETIGIDPKHCLYIGDAERDIVAGNRAGMHTVLANWGYISEEDTPLEWGADTVIHHPRELSDCLLKIKE